MSGGGSYGKIVLEKRQNYTYKTGFVTENIQYFVDSLSANMNFESETRENVLVHVLVQSEAAAPEFVSEEVRQFFVNALGLMSAARARDSSGEIAPASS